METPDGVLPRIGAGSQIVDLSVILSDTTTHYPTDPAFHKSVYTDFAGGGVLVSRLEMGAHTGTHVDAPLHVLKGAASICDLPIWQFFGPALALEAPKRPGENIEPADFEKAHIKRGEIVLFRTGWEERSGTPGFFQHEWPAISLEAADALLAREVKAVGLDSPSADAPKGIAAGFSSHKRLLAAGVPIFEALVNLERLVGKRFFFIGLPLSIEHGEASPVRAIAILG
jgi:kynurenine formamidase